ncbi:MAG: dihydrofolate reductase [Caldimonas sp.]
MPAPTVSLIAAVARNGGIGKNNALLAHLPDDLAHFKRTTLGSPVLMGRKTWDSIGRALPGRRNVVVTRNPAFAAAGAERAASFEAALELLANEPKIYVIGGASIYAAALPRANELVLTEIDADLDADTFFPAWNRADFRQTSHRMQRSPQGWDYSYATYTRQHGS